jgi:hypothetical protein
MTFPCSGSVANVPGILDTRPVDPLGRPTASLLAAESPLKARSTLPELTLGRDAHRVQFVGFDFEVFQELRWDFNGGLCSRDCHVE